MNQEEKIIQSYKKLKSYIENHNYSGYDPYDALNSKKIHSIKNRYFQLILTQLFVYSPINLRKQFHIKEEKNPKALALILSSYCNAYKAELITKDEFNKKTKKIIHDLLQLRSQDYTHYCWGFNFPWQDLNRYSPKWLPTIVISSYVGHAFIDFYDITKKQEYLNIAKSIANFILKDLNQTETKNGICFSYTPIDTLTVYNANSLGASLLTRLSQYTKNKELILTSKKAMDFTIYHQKNNGSWAYSTNLKNGKERNQIDFHQGFILDSIIDFIKNNKTQSDPYQTSLQQGINFYFNQQFEQNGQSKWRLPLRNPVDIHLQAQGIITFTKMYNLTKEKKYLKLAKKISIWTIKHMQDKEGHFYYQKWPFYTNKISYMRWNQSWMILALSLLILAMKQKEMT